MELSEEFNMRPAVPSDIEDINTLSKRCLGDGYTTDYLAGRYIQYLKKERMFACVICKGDSLVGFVMYYVVDGGKTMLGMSARMDPHLRQQGLIKASGVKIIAHELLPRWPHICRIRGTSTRNDYYKVDMKDRVNILDQRHVMRCHIKHGKMQSQIPDGCYIVGDKQLLAIINDKTASRRLFPKDVIINNTDVFNVDPENLQDLLYFNDLRLASSYRGDSVDSPSEVCALSLGTLLTCNDQESYRYNFNYYGDVDLDLLEKHIFFHLASNRQNLNKLDMYFIFMIPEQFVLKFGAAEMYRYFDRLCGSDSNEFLILTQVAFEYLKHSLL